MAYRAGRREDEAGFPLQRGLPPSKGPAKADRLRDVTRSRKARSFLAVQFQKVFIFGKIRRTVFPNDNCQIFNDHFSIQTPYFCGSFS